MLAESACKNATGLGVQKRRRLADLVGLYLEISPTGTKRWFWKFYPDGKESRLALGSHPEVSHKAARLARGDARKLRQTGTSPVQARRTKKLAAAASSAVTFEAVAREYHASRKTPYTNEQNGQTYLECRLTKRDSLVLIARLSPEFTARVVDCWQELEAGAASAHQIPQTFAQALMLAAKQAEQIERQQAQLEAARPAVEFVGRYVEAEGLKGFREVCKLPKANEARFRDFLFARKVMYRLCGQLTAYQDHIDAGLQGRDRNSSVRGDSHGYLLRAVNRQNFAPDSLRRLTNRCLKQLLLYKVAGRN